MLLIFAQRSGAPVVPWRRDWETEKRNAIFLPSVTPEAAPPPHAVTPTATTKSAETNLAIFITWGAATADGILTPSPALAGEGRGGGRERTIDELFVGCQGLMPDKCRSWLRWEASWPSRSSCAI